MSRSFFHIRVLALLTMLCCSVSAFSQNIPRPNIAGPMGLYVNSFTGSLFYQRTDLVIPGLGMPVQIRFSYNSADRSVDHGFGYGWTFEYNRYYSTDSAGITIHNSDGRTDQFTSTNSEYKAAKGIFDVLTQYSPGKFRLINTDNVEYYFDDASHKRLTSIKDRNGNTLSFSYNGGKLEKIIDASGRQVSFGWTSGRLSEVKAEAASPARVFKYVYNAAGCLTSVTDPMNYSVFYFYGAERIMTGAMDKNGNNSVATYNANKAVIKLVSCQREISITYNVEQKKTYLIEKNDEKTIVTNYEFDGEGRLIGKSGNCCGFKNSYEYDDANNISKVADANGNITLFTYDKRGNLLTETDPLGKAVIYTYLNQSNKVRNIKDKKGNATNFVYDEKENVKEVQYPLGVTMKYAYDAKGNMTTSTDALTNLTVFSYNASGYVTQRKDALGGTMILEYDGWGNILSQTDARNNPTQYDYDALNRVTKVTDALGQVVQFTYDGNGNLTAFTDARNNKTQYVYDAENNVIISTDALGNPVIRTYDALRSITSSKDANGRISGYVYDHLNRLTVQTNPSGERTVYEYDNNGNPSVIRYPNGNVVNIKYDALNRAVELKDNLGILTTYSFDDNGNKLSETDAGGNTIGYQYDALNRLIKQIDALGNGRTYEYDAANNLTKETDRNGNSTVYKYDLLNRQVLQTNALSFNTEFGYDANGNLTAVTDPKGNLTQYVYDELNRNKEERFANNTLRTFAYDASNNLLSRKDNAGVVTGFSYDKLNRLIAKSNASGVDSFFFDKVGQMLRASNRSANIEFSYDNAGRVAMETSNGKSTTYSYNLSGGVNTIAYPSGKIVTRSMNARGQLLEIRTDGKLALTVTYDALGQVVNKKFGNNTQADYTYNSNKDITSIAHGPSRFLDFTYSYDKEENPSAARFNHRTSSAEQYSYDNLNQLTGFVKGAQQSIFNYDGVGNRMTANVNGVSTTYASNNMNAYTSVAQGSPLPLSYDANGNLINDGKNTYSYDSENRFVSVNNGVTANYIYDALGRCIRKTLPTDTIEYSFSGLQVLEERSSKGQVVTNYVWGSWADDIVSMNRNNQQFYYHTNTLGTVSAVSDSTGNVVERYEYDAFGNASFFSNTYVARTSSSIGNNYLFTGKEFQSETGLYNYKARQFSGRFGRFLQKDPINFLDVSNKYLFVYNNPQTWVDPDGASPTLITAAIGATIGGVFGGSVALYNGGTWAEVGRGAAKGAIVGGVTGLTLGFGGAAIAGSVGGGLFGGALAGGVASGVGNLAGQGFDYGLNPDCFKFSWGELALSSGLGAIGGGIGSYFRSAGSQLQNSSKFTKVTSWSGKETPDLTSRRWVIKGEATFANYLKTGLWGPRLDGTLLNPSSWRLTLWTPLKGQKFITEDVLTSQLVKPVWFRAIWGQYQIK